MKYESDLPRHERELLQNILLRDEELRWTGRPIPYYFQKETAGIVGFGVFWSMLCGLFTYLTLTMGDEVPQAVFFILGPFDLVGLFLLCSPLFTHRKSKKIFYALTNKRAIIVEPGFFFGHNIHYFELAEDMVREQQLQNDGRGDLVFGYVEAYQQNHRPVMRGVGFLNIPDMKAVEQKIFDLLQEKAASL